MHFSSPKLLLTSFLPFLSLSFIVLSSTTTSVQAAHAGFSVHYPWITRDKFKPSRPGLVNFLPFCGVPKHNPQAFSILSPTFLSFSGHPGDLVTVLYTRLRTPRRRSDFNVSIVHDVPIPASGQLCLDRVVAPMGRDREHELGVFYFEGRDPAAGDAAEPTHFCADVKLSISEATAEGHPAMCARNNETLIPMPDEWT